MNPIKTKIPGIILAIFIMLVAKFLSLHLPSFGTALLALLLGIIGRQLIQFKSFLPGVTWSEKYILETAIVFIGFGFEFSKFKEIGVTTLIVLFLSILLIIGIAFLLQKLSKDKTSKLFLLLGIGSSICGSAAIGATAPLVKAKEEETGAALTVINLLGMSGMILLPLIGKLFHFSEVEMGVFLGGILQSMGHVVGAGFALGHEIGEYATLVKMGRVTFLVPFILIIYFLYRKKEDGTKLKFPLFILFFLIAVLISQLNILDGNSLKFVSKSGDYLLNIGMAAIGLKINIKELWNISTKALGVGLLIFTIQIGVYILYLI